MTRRSTPSAYAARSNFIDDHVMARLRELRLEPSPACDDATFLRRASLDLTGSLPSAEEAAAFLDDPSPDKRAALVDRLMASPAFVDYWAMAWGELFQNRRERDQDKRGRKGVRGLRPLDPRAGPGRPPVGRAGPRRPDRPGAADRRAGRRLLPGQPQARGPRRGRRPGVPRHPDRMRQVPQPPARTVHPGRLLRDGRLLQPGQARRQADRPGPGRRRRHARPSAAARGPKATPSRSASTQPRTGKFLPPRPLDRSTAALEPGQDPRERPGRVDDRARATGLFARSIVNRVWKRFFAVGLVEPVDDLRATNPASNEPLLDALCDDLIAHKYDLKRLMRLIVDVADLRPLVRPPADQRRRPDVLLALPPPPAPGRGPGRRPGRGDRRARGLRGPGRRDPGRAAPRPRRSATTCSRPSAGPSA